MIARGWRIGGWRGGWSGGWRGGWIGCWRDWWIGALLPLVLAACGGKGGGGPTPEPGPVPADPKAQAADVQAVQAKVPAGIAITFEAVLGDKERHVAIQPKGWETGVIPGRVKPPVGSSLGFMTAFSTGTNCDGDCSPKDWAKVADSVEFAQFAGGSWKIEKDEKLADGRILVAKGEDRVDIVLAKWKDGADRYFMCRVTLDKEIVSAAPAFEEACRRLTVRNW